jgi:N-acyl-D-amino-acid deacylase
MPDMLVRNGIIVDGTGREGFRGCVHVIGDRIKAVIPSNATESDDIEGAEIGDIIDAEGLVVAPGFIDCHSHFDWVLPLRHHQKFLFPLIEQGITTVVTGNCGFSPAPITEDNQKLVRDLSDILVAEPFSYNWQGMDEFLNYLDSAGGLLFNNAQLVGHGTVHLEAVRDIKRRPDSAESAAMITLIAAAFDSGAFGLSFGLMYPPGLFSAKDDLTGMARAASDRDRILTVHMRALSKYSGSYPIIPFLGKPHNLRALDEILSIGLETGVRLQISHFIFAGKKSWPTVQKAVGMVEKAKAKGLEVMWDIYPHFCGNSYLSVFLPAWFLENLEDNLENHSAIRKLKFELGMAKFLVGFNMSDIQIMDAGYPAGKKYNRLNLVEIARQEGIDPVEAMLKIIKESDGKALQLTYGYSGDDDSEQLIEKLMANELCLFETDTLLRSSGFPNPASYGAFPRILGRFVRDKKTLGLADAISRMSGKTARWMGIAERGEIKPGYFADLVLFNPDTIADNTTVKETARRPTGIEKVFINGELVVEKGRYLNDKKYGRVLRAR